MRYAQGGGLNAERWQAREQIRLEAAGRFARGEKNARIAKELRVTERSVERWRRRWHEAGEQGLASRGSPGRPKRTDTQFALLEQELAKGPAVHGWADQRWTLSRVQTVIGRRSTPRSSSKTKRDSRWRRHVPTPGAHVARRPSCGSAADPGDAGPSPPCAATSQANGPG
nr:helix-turn-helix domain-containing protein [Streptomyces noursei]